MPVLDCYREVKGEPAPEIPWHPSHTSRPAGSAILRPNPSYKPFSPGYLHRKMGLFMQIAFGPIRPPISPA